MNLGLESHTHTHARTTRYVITVRTRKNRSACASANLDKLMPLKRDPIMKAGPRCAIGRTPDS